MRFQTFQVKDQEATLIQLAELVERNALQPLVRRAAMSITADCDNRDDLCELQAIYDAVQSGTNSVEGLRRGLRYVADPRSMDYFTGAKALLENAAAGAAAGDCDDHASLVGSLGAALGFKMGMRAWRPAKKKDFVHVYAVALIPKRGPFEKVVGMDTTVAKHLGWEPPRGQDKDVLTAWIG